MDAAILVFVRAPEPGRVKTRLAAGIGPDAALRAYRRLAEHTVCAARAAGAALRIHYTPAGSAEVVREWLGAGAEYRPQSPGDLGERMQCAFLEAFGAGYRRVVIVGSDLPTLTAELLDEALELLRTHPAVLGPAEDGGYWLLGLREPAPFLFEQMPWSTASVFGETLRRLRARGLEPARLPVLRDVDAAEDLPPDWAAQR